jgi:hypothetical protein
MTGFAETEPTYSQVWQIGETYEWPDIPYFTQTRGCLRMTLCAGWVASSYRDYPMPLDDLGSILEQMIVANPCFKVLSKTVSIESSDPADLEKDGWKIVGGWTQDVIAEHEHEDGWIEREYGPLYLPVGGVAKLEKLEPLSAGRVK